ncbi:hypothetical protein [Bdellovibrio sp. HCB337]|uniref:hypothetical protein n=1 Tax=Bdellovibrio sp. HCB337 TaxID=3394358 RepID=UPI0039A744E8
MKMMSFAIVATLMGASAAQAKTILCSGLSQKGEIIVLSVIMDESLKTTISIQAGDHENSWDADQMTFDQRSDEAILTASAGDRGEYYIQVKVPQTSKTVASVSYDENDSGWEFSAESKKLTCKTK